VVAVSGFLDDPRRRFGDDFCVAHHPCVTASAFWPLRVSLFVELSSWPADHPSAPPLAALSAAVSLGRHLRS
jgi:hypothetical protein